jgi:DNA-directed RNA polymerase specialized sigma24 family protein
MDFENYKNFKQFREKLRYTAVRKGVHYDDIDLLIDKSIENGINNFDKSRGEYLAFCRTILENLIKNYFRYGKKYIHFDEDNIPPIIEVDRDLEDRERINHMKKIVAMIVDKLDEKEKSFFLEYKKLLSEYEQISVSEAARRLGLPPNEGWNIVRKIQRRAEEYRDDLEKLEVLTPVVRGKMPVDKTLKKTASPNMICCLTMNMPSPDRIAEPNTLFMDIIRYDNKINEYCTKHFFNMLTEEQRIRMTSFLS